MTPQGFSDFVGDNQFMKLKMTCYDCDTDFDIDVERTGPKEIQITGGALYETQSGWDIAAPFLGKCTKCFEAKPRLNIPTSIYSRVVGYMRPVSGWNAAKQTEFAMRKTFTVPEGCDPCPQEQLK